MPRMGRQFAKLRKVPIVSNKEVVDAVSLIVAGGVTTDIVVATQTNNYLGTVGTCPLGANIKGFLLDVSTNNVDNIVGRTDWYIAKLAAGQIVVNYPTPGATGGTVFRKLIFHEEKGIFQGTATTGGGNAKRGTVFVSIPPKFQRMAEADQWFIRAGSSENYSFCLKCIYKWYI